MYQITTYGNLTCDTLRRPSIHAYTYGLSNRGSALAECSRFPLAGIGGIQPCGVRFRTLSLNVNAS